MFSLKWVCRDLFRGSVLRFIPLETDQTVFSSMMFQEFVLHVIFVDVGSLRPIVPDLKRRTDFVFVYFCLFLMLKVLRPIDRFFFFFCHWRLSTLCFLWSGC